MSKEALYTLRDYIRLTLSPTDIEWLAAAIVAPTDEIETLKPYTIEELHEQIAQSEQDLSEGRYRYIEEIFRDWDEEDEVADHAAEPLPYYSGSKS